jgi:hypothetical protein
MSKKNTVYLRITNIKERIYKWIYKIKNKKNNYN